jgi:hypothetical protein
MARKGVVTDAQVPVDISDEEVVVGLEVDVVVAAAVVGGALEVISEEDCVFDEVLLDVDDEEDSAALDVESELLKSEEVVWEAELEVLEATSLLEEV